MKTYGPYRRSDGRAHVIHYDPSTKTRKTQSYPRFLMEQHLGRCLTPLEEVDHINEDRTDDRIDNYQLLPKGANLKKHHESSSHRKEEVWRFQCSICGKSFERPARRVRDKQHRQGAAGPFCSKGCSGTYGARVQNSK